MSSLKPSTDVLYFASVLYQSHIEPIKLLGLEIDSELTPSYNPLLNYYSKEMGDSLKRQIFLFPKIESRELLVSKKSWAHNLEQSTLASGKRTVNIDIGYLSLEQMVLATGKPYSHRIYLGEGVYADLNYIFENKTYKKLSWTYPDYADQEKIDWFNLMRKKLIH